MGKPNVKVFTGQRRVGKSYLLYQLLPTSEVVKREYESLEAIPGQYPKYVVSLDKQAPENHNGIGHLYILDFLNKTGLGVGSSKC